MLGLKLWVCMGDQRAWLAQAKPQLAKKPLALPHPQRNFITLFDEGCQDLPVPQASLQAKVLWTLSQRLLDFAQLALVEPPGATRPLPVDKAGQPLLLETMNPVRNRPRRVSQQQSHLTTTHSLSHQQHPMEAMVVARFHRPANLILQAENHCISFRYLELSHARRILQVSDMRNYL